PSRTELRRLEAGLRRPRFVPARETRGHKTEIRERDRGSRNARGGNRTPVRKPASVWSRVTRTIQVRGIPTMTILARTRSDHQFPAALTRFEHVRMLAR